MSIFRFSSFSYLTCQLSDNSSYFSFTRNAFVRRYVRIEDDSFSILSATRETASTALAFRQCFFYFADERIFFHGKFLIGQGQDEAKDDANTGHDNNRHYRDLSVINHNYFFNSFA